MKILIATDSSFYPVLGGADRAAFEQAQRLVRRGHEVAVLCRDKASAYNQKTIVQGIKVYFIGVKAATAIGVFARTFWEGRRLARHLARKTQWDAVLFHQPITALALRGLAELKPAAKLYFFHSPLSLEYALRHPRPLWSNRLQMKILERIEGAGMGQAGVVLFASKYMKNRAEEIHPATAYKPHAVLPLGVDFEKFREKNGVAAPRQKLKIPSGVPVALTVRNLEPRMGLEGLLDAWKFVIQKIPVAHLVVGGSGSLKPALEEKIKRWGLESNVRLEGFIPEENLPAYYQAADFFVLPTMDLEGFGLVTLEALASGTPVLGTHVGGIPEVLEPFDAALLFPSRRSHLVAERIVRFIEGKEWEKFSPAKCREYAEKNFSWDKSVEGIEKLIHELSQQDRRRR